LQLKLSSCNTLHIRELQDRTSVRLLSNQTQEDPYNFRPFEGLVKLLSLWRKLLMRRIGAFVLLFLSLFAVASFAQNATTSLRGVIKDPSGAVVGGATITLVNDAAGQN
jgi:hypothetical protein